VDDLFVQQSHGANSNSGTWKGRGKHTVRSAGSWGQGQRKRVRKKKGERGVEGEKMNELYFMRSKTDLYIYIYNI